MSEKLKPATDLDSNVWYQLSELAVDDDDVDLKSMLQPTSPGGDLRVWDANKQSYWQFRTRPCLMPIDDTDAQKWDVAIWGSGEYRVTNVDVGEGWNLDCIPSGPVFMSSNLEGEQLRQHWVMSSVGKVDDEMYSTIYTAPPSSTDATTATTGSDSTVPSTTSTDTSDSSNSESTSESTSEASGSTGLSSGAIAGISVGATLGVVALALAAFFLWRRNRRKYHAAGTNDSVDKHDNSPIVVTPNTTYSGTYAGDKTHPPSEMAHEQMPQELSTGQHQRHELA
ncbi:Transmembrane alpha-helix [Fusarium acuminatum]|uniref:Transmembrane alpha-helix n=1 Tax=Fusarium acuminatum TaxID=5515 RepID=A0ABZ2X507_9HYPO